MEVRERLKIAVSKVKAIKSLTYSQLDKELGLNIGSISNMVNGRKKANEHVISLLYSRFDDVFNDEKDMLKASEPEIKYGDRTAALKRYQQLKDERDLLQIRLDSINIEMKAIYERFGHVGGWEEEVDNLERD